MRAASAVVADRELDPKHTSGAHELAGLDAERAPPTHQEEATFTIELDEDELAGAPTDDDDADGELDPDDAVANRLDQDSDDEDESDDEDDDREGDEEDARDSSALREAGETASALLLTEPRRKRSGLLRRVRQFALAALLVPALVSGGAYFARPFLPGWVVPATVVAWFDGWIDGWHGWLERLPLPRSIREDRSARDPAAPDREASNR